MDIVQLITLAIIQGLTEFLPVSSSGHLILSHELLGWPDQGQAFDVALHIGTAIAVIFYFRKELKMVVVDWIKSIKIKEQVGESKLGWCIIIGTIPACFFGLIIKMIPGDPLRSPLVIATTLIIFGLLLGWASLTGKGKKNENSITLRDAIIIGCAQALALIPGTSRSGITITAALFRGYSPIAAARFSFLLSIPAIVLAGGLHTVKLISSPGVVHWRDMGLGMFISAITALLCIHFFLKLIQKINMIPFVIYRIAMGLALFWMFV